MKIQSEPVWRQDSAQSLRCQSLKRSGRQPSREHRQFRKKEALILERRKGAQKERVAIKLKIICMIMLKMHLPVRNEIR